MIENEWKVNCISTYVWVFDTSALMHFGLCLGYETRLATIPLSLFSVHHLFCIFLSVSWGFLASLLPQMRGAVFLLLLFYVADFR